MENNCHIVNRPNDFLKMEYIEKISANGFVTETFFLKNKKLQGTYKKYDNQKLTLSINYLDGKKYGDTIYFENERIIKKEIFENDNLIETFVYEYDGLFTKKIRIINNKYDGVSLLFYDGKLCEKGYYKNNEKNGNFYQYYTNGSLHRKTHYSNNKKNGISILWLPNKENNSKSGPISNIFHYKNDKLHGKFIEYFYPKIGDSNYFDNSGYIKKSYYCNGLKQGIFIKMNWDKVIIKKTSYYNNLQNGKVKIYDSNGNLVQKGFYKKGKKQGKWIHYFPNLFKTPFSSNTEYNLQEKKIIYYDNNKKTGKFTSFFPNGSIFSIAYFKNNLIEGKARFFFFNLDKNSPLKNRIIRYYKNNKKNGIELVFNENQKLIQKNYYKDHLLHGSNQCFLTNSNSIYHYGTKSLIQKNKYDICSICYEKTKYQSKCNHFVCHKCFFKMNNINCPICRRIMDYNEI